MTWTGNRLQKRYEIHRLAGHQLVKHLVDPGLDELLELPDRRRGKAHRTIRRCRAWGSPSLNSSTSGYGQPSDMAAATEGRSS